MPHLLILKDFQRMVLFQYSSHTNCSSTFIIFLPGFHRCHFLTSKSPQEHHLAPIIPTLGSSQVTSVIPMSEQIFHTLWHVSPPDSSGMQILKWKKKNPFGCKHFLRMFSLCITAVLRSFTSALGETWS